MKTIKLPTTFNDKEIEFIEKWYSEAGILQLKVAGERNSVLTVLTEKPPAKGMKYVSIKGIPVDYIHRDRSTLRQIRMTELKTVKLLLLNEWIK